MSGNIIVFIIGISLIAIPVVWLVLLNLVCPPCGDQKISSKGGFPAKLPNALAE